MFKPVPKIERVDVLPIQSSAVGSAVLGLTNYKQLNADVIK